MLSKHTSTKHTNTLPGALYSDDETTRNQVKTEKEKRQEDQLQNSEKEQSRPGDLNSDAVAWNAITHGIGIAVGKTEVEISACTTLSTLQNIGKFCSSFRWCESAFVTLSHVCSHPANHITGL